MPIFLAHTVGNPRAMMIMGSYTFFTLMAVLSPIWLVDHTNSAVESISLGSQFLLAKP